MSINRLIILRHGKTEVTSPSGRDYDRRLTARGERNSRAMAEIITKDTDGGVPHIVVVSPAARALQTWQEVAKVWAGGANEAGSEGGGSGKPIALPRLVTDQRVYGASVDVLCLAIAEALAQADGETAGEHGERAVMVVGHNPGLHMLAGWLLGDAGAAIPHLPTAGVVDIALPAGALVAGEGKLLGFYRP